MQEAAVCSMDDHELSKAGGQLGLWIVSLLLALMFNVILFDVMPRLVRQGPPATDLAEPIGPLEVVRIKRPESPVRRKETKQEIKPNVEQRRIIKQKVYMSPSVRQTVSIPFEVNPKLPPIPGTLPVRPVTELPLGHVDLKGVFDVSQIDNPLVAIVRIPPLYPMYARTRGIEGWVQVRFIVDEQGRVRDLTIVDSHPKKVFDNAVLRCVPKWRFKPGTIEGIPVKTLAETTIRFDLE